MVRPLVPGHWLSFAVVASVWSLLSVECYGWDCGWSIWVWVVAAIDIDSNWRRTMVDVHCVLIRAVERWFVVSRAVVDLKLKFLSVC